jgi:uncharacterized membrane protein YphA (DoxX/SURF4 family)
MSDAQSNRKTRIIDLATIGARLLLGALFVYTGIEKVFDPVAFLKLVRQYDLVHAPFLLNSIAAMLPWFEACCGVLLLLGIAVRGTALTVVAVLVPFTIVVWHRALILESAKLIPFCAVKFDCGCGTGEVFICAKLLENFCLVLLSCWLLSGRGRRYGLRYSIVGD